MCFKKSTVCTKNHGQSLLNAALDVANLGMNHGNMIDTVFEFGIPLKLIRLCRLTLSNTKGSVRIRKDLSVVRFQTR